METHTRPTHGPWSARVTITLIALTLSAAAGRAGAAETSGTPGNPEDRGNAGDPGNNISRTQDVGHVRMLDTRSNAALVEGVRRSPTLRALVDRLNRSTVIVYVEYRLLLGNLSGRLTFAGLGQSWRYLRIEIECRQSTVGQIAALGHELQHAVEIADAPKAVDDASIRALYTTIGFAIDDRRQRFESEAARAAGERVRRELSGPSIGSSGATTSYHVP